LSLFQKKKSTTARTDDHVEEEEGANKRKEQTLRDLALLFISFGIFQCSSLDYTCTVDASHPLSVANNRLLISFFSFSLVNSKCYLLLKKSSV